MLLTLLTVLKDIKEKLKKGYQSISVNQWGVSLAIFLRWAVLEASFFTSFYCVKIKNHWNKIE